MSEKTEIQAPNVSLIKGGLYSQFCKIWLLQEIYSTMQAVWKNYFKKIDAFMSFLKAEGLWWKI